MTVVNDDTSLIVPALSQLVQGPVTIQDDLTVTGNLDVDGDVTFLGTHTLPFAIVFDAAGLIAAIAAQNSLGIGGKIIAAPGIYDLPAGAGPTITCQRAEILLHGCTIVFHPTAHDQAAFTFDNGVSTLNFCAIRGAAFSSPNTTFRKIMIQHVDSWGFQVSDISSADGAWTDASFLSEGVRSKGRYRHHLHSSAIHTDIPLHIMANTRAAGIGIDTDRFLFGPELDLASATGNPCVKVDADVVFKSTTFFCVDFQKGGIERAGTAATASIHLEILSCHFEQLSAAQWCVDLSGTNVIQELTIGNVRIANSGKGIRVRNVTQFSLTRVFDAGSSVALDIDGTVFNTTAAHYRVGALSTVSIVNQTLSNPGPPCEETSPLRSAFFTYQSTLSAFAKSAGTVGTATNDNAVAGDVGELISASLAAGSAIALVNDTGANVVSVSLTAGDWDCSAAMLFTFGATTSYTYLLGSISLTSAVASSTDFQHFAITVPATVPGNVIPQSHAVPTVRLSLAATTTVYLVVSAGFTVSTLAAFGALRCRRVR